MLSLPPLQQLKQMQKITYLIDEYIHIYISKLIKYEVREISDQETEFQMSSSSENQQYCKIIKYNYPYILPDGTSFFFYTI